MKFSITNLLCAILVVAFCVGWWVDRSELQSRIEENSKHVDAIVAGSVYINARSTYYHAVSTELIAKNNEQLSEMNEEDLLNAFMRLFRNQKDVEIYLAHTNGSRNADLLPTKILLALQCETTDDFMSIFTSQYSAWLTSIENSTEVTAPIFKRVDVLLARIPKETLDEFRSDQFSLQRPWP